MLCNAAQPSSTKSYSLDLLASMHLISRVLPHVAQAMPHGRVVLCALLALAGRDAFKLQDRAVNTNCKRARDRRFTKAWSSATLPKPPRNPPVLPPFKQARQLVPAHVVLQIKVRLLCLLVMGCHHHIPPIHFQVPPHSHHRPPSTVRQADSALSLRL